MGCADIISMSYRQKEIANLAEQMFMAMDHQAGAVDFEPLSRGKWRLTLECVEPPAPLSFPQLFEQEEAITVGDLLDILDQYDDDLEIFPDVFEERGELNEVFMGCVEEGVMMVRSQADLDQQIQWGYAGPYIVLGTKGE